MPTNEEGEFELVLGNKQLLSVFFLVVLLLGVFFSMGYIVGRNTAPAPNVSAANRQPPILVDSAGPGSGRPPSTTPSPAVLTPLTPDTPKPSPSDAKPVVKPEPPPKPEPVKQAAASKPEPPPPSPKPEPVKAAAAAVQPEPPKPAPAAATVAAATKGATYLQVVATKRGEAEQVVAKLAAKGFSAIISPVPDSQLVRVLVGPVAEPNVAKTRDGLNAAGFKPMVRKF